MEKGDQKKGVLCNHCDYNWQTTSINKFVSCPSCLKKTEVKKDE